MPRYSKPALSLSDLSAKMIARGLTVSNPTGFAEALRNQGYYRLGGYAYPFLIPPDRKVFKAGATWDQVARLYEFDRELRLLVSDAVERIEVGIRALLISATTLALVPVGSSGAFAQAGPHWFMDPGRFHAQFDHAGFISKIEKEVGIKHDRVTRAKILPQKHSEDFIEHYYSKYGDPYLPPFWMVAEVLTLGSLSTLYKGLGDPAWKLTVAAPFGLTAKVMGSWLHALSHLRNICAHHGRLWNRTFSISPLVPLHLAGTLHKADKFEGMATVLVEMLKVTAPADDWKSEFRAVLVKFPEIDPRAMGFGPSWTTPYWQS